MRAIFMGTPDLAAQVLSCLLSSEHEIIAVVTQPDRPKGRGKEIVESPVKQLAKKHSIPVLQPTKVRERESVDALLALHPDIILVAAFGQILSKEILDLPKYGCINVHTSMLPLYRGSAPIQWCILDGKETTGVTIMKMDEGVDTGDIILQKEIAVSEQDTGESLYQKLAAEGGPLLLTALRQISDQTAVYTKQPAGEFPYAKMLKKEMGRMDFRRPAEELDRQIRGLYPWPGAYTMWDGKLLKIFSAFVSYEKAETCPCGTLVSVKDGFLWIMTGKGLLKISELQPEGKRRMTTEEFLRGYPLKEGLLFQS